MTELQTLQAQLDLLQAKQDLLELNARYCEGVDRGERDTLTALWWPEGTIDFGLFDGPGAEFAELIGAPNPALEVNFHFASNQRFEIDGERANGRSYVIGKTCMVGEDGARTEQMVGGRYLDKYERRQGQWRFLKRLFVIDWISCGPSTANWETGIGAAACRGRLDSDDISYRFFAS